MTVSDYTNRKFIMYTERHLTCNDVMSTLHRSSFATRDCRINDIAVTSVSIADAYSPAAASDTARDIALHETVRFRFIISSISASDSGSQLP